MCAFSLFFPPPSQGRLGDILSKLIKVKVHVCGGLSLRTLFSLLSPIIPSPLLPSPLFQHRNIVTFYDFWLGRDSEHQDRVSDSLIKEKQDLLITIL